LALCFERRVHAWVSTACTLAPKPAKRGGEDQAKDRAGHRCQALKLLDTAAAYGPLSEGDLRGGKNPGAVLCGKSGGAVRFATLENGSQITFCEAADHSVIDCNALDTAWAGARAGK
jgi:putative hemolysin